MKLNFIFFIIIFFASFNLASKNIVTINIQSLIDNNNQYKEILEDMELSQKKYLNKLEIKESELEKFFSDIQNSKLIVNESEFNLQIDQYNRELNKFSSLVDEFNYHYQKQIINIRDIILKEIIVLLEKYAIQHKIDLVFDSTSYLLASNTLDITNIIENELNNIYINLEYNNFEKN